MQLSDVIADAPTTTDAASELFDSLPAVDPEFMIGTWRGAEMPTGHPIDGALAASGWWGKQFIDAENVHPLLFPSRDGKSLWPMNPVMAFSALGALRAAPQLRNMSFAGPIGVTNFATRARGSKARLRTTRYRGVDSATMVYDQLPINDVFHRLSDDSVLGAMDLKGVRRPYFFVLKRDESLPVR